MRIYYLSDIHIESHEGYLSDLEGVLPLEENHEKDWVVVAGDISSSPSVVRDILGYLSSKFGHVFFVMGNHEYRNDSPSTYKSTEKLYKALLSSISNLHFLNNEVVEVDGLTVAGSTYWYELADNYSKAWWKTFSNDYVYVHRDWDDSNRHHDRDFKFLQSLKDKKIDLLVTHFPPKSFRKERIEDLELSHIKDSGVRPRYWICGHEHVCCDEDFNGSRVLMNPVGYQDEDTSYIARYVDIEPM